ncbi:hypothetical protein SAN_2063, partial [Streptococcus agalactiae COH1]
MCKSYRITVSCGNFPGHQGEKGDISSPIILSSD